MELTHTARIDVPLARAWELLGGLEVLASALGAEEVVCEGDTCRGTLAVKIGPLTVRYEGAATVTWRDEDAGRVVLEVEGGEVEGVGQVRATVNVTLGAVAGSTRVSVLANLTASGRLSQYGPAVLTDVGDRLLAGLVAHLEATVLAVEIAEARAARSAPAPEPQEARGARRRRRGRRGRVADEDLPAPLPHGPAGDLGFEPPEPAVPDEALPSWVVDGDDGPDDARDPGAPLLTWSRSEDVDEDGDPAPVAAAAPEADPEPEPEPEPAAQAQPAAEEPAASTEAEPAVEEPAPRPPLAARPVEPLVWKPAAGPVRRRPTSPARPAPRRPAAATRRPEPPVAAPAPERAPVEQEPPAPAPAPEPAAPSSSLPPPPPPPPSSPVPPVPPEPAAPPPAPPPPSPPTVPPSGSPRFAEPVVEAADEVPEAVEAVEAVDEAPAPAPPAGSTATPPRQAAAAASDPRAVADRPIDVLGPSTSWSDGSLAQRAAPIALALAILWLLRRLFGSSEE